MVLIVCAAQYLAFKERKMDKLAKRDVKVKMDVLMVLLIAAYLIDIVHSSRQKSANDGWSEWSDWSSCSRSCDGGTMYQLRRCKLDAGCIGDPIVYSICNIEPCEKSSLDFKDQQCHSFNSIPYKNKYYIWESHYDPEDLCALTCKARGVNLIAKFSSQVRDGTRCRKDSLDMCINGVCRTVGCDYKLGSNLKLDNCGVCGGDGSTCQMQNDSPLWDTRVTDCSVTCGGGYQFSTALCRDGRGVEVDGNKCDVTRKPTTQLVKCNEDPCRGRWMAKDWSSCSRPCGGGSRHRGVWCALKTNGSMIKVDDKLCDLSSRPLEHEACNDVECPSWEHTHWSECSASCGEGIQTREVTCQDRRGHPSISCDPIKRPDFMRSCQTGVKCSSGDKTVEELDDPIASYFESSAEALKLMKSVFPAASSSDPFFIEDPWNPCSVTCGEGLRTREVKCQIFLEFSRTNATLPDKDCIGKKPPTVEPCDAGPCPVAMKSESGKIDPLSLISYSRVKPSGSEKKVTYGVLKHYGHDPSDDDDIRNLIPWKSIKPKPKLSSDNESDNKKSFIAMLHAWTSKNKPVYHWRKNGFTPCSASCLGGIQETLVKCVRESDDKIVSPYKCDLTIRPEIMTRTCNDHPCPPRWNVTDYSPCSKSCGGGVQSREVSCIHEVTRGSGNTLQVSNSLCPHPNPPSEQFCNVIDCPARWVPGPWEKCSKPCGGGEKVRKLRCQQVLSLGHILNKSPSFCSNRRPKSSTPCNSKPCKKSKTKVPLIREVEDQNFIQSEPLKQLTLKIGGKASVFRETTLKIRCPVKNYNRSKLKWLKNGKSIIRTRRIRVSSKGALILKKVNYKSSAIYTCVAGAAQANLSLVVRPDPSRMTSSEEIDRLDFSNEITKNEDIKKTEYSHVQDKEGVPQVSMGEEWPYFSSEIIVEKDVRTSEETDESLNSLEDQYGDEGREYWFNDEGGDRRLTDTAKHGEIVPHYKQPYTSSGSPSVTGPLQSVVTTIKALMSPHQGGDESPEARKVTDSDGESERVTTDREVKSESTQKTVHYEWFVTEWTPCSVSCGAAGFQLRASQCILKLKNETRPVNESHCLEARLDTPLKMRHCGLAECPRWSGSWTKCRESSCFTYNTAVQKRNLTCALRNSTVVDSSLCSWLPRPPEQRECYNDRCRGVWKSGEWSSCSAQCGEEGFQSRLLQCVWYGTDIVAGNACKDMPRPAVMKICSGPTCSPDADSSRKRIRHFNTKVTGVATVLATATRPND